MHLRSRKSHEATTASRRPVSQSLNHVGIVIADPRLARTFGILSFIHSVSVASIILLQRAVLSGSSVIRFRGYTLVLLFQDHHSHHLSKITARAAYPFFLHKCPRIRRRESRSTQQVSDLHTHNHKGAKAAKIRASLQGSASTPDPRSLSFMFSYALLL